MRCDPVRHLLSSTVSGHQGHRAGVQGPWAAASRRELETYGKWLKTEHLLVSIILQTHHFNSSPDAGLYQVASVCVSVRGSSVCSVWWRTLMWCWSGTEIWFPQWVTQSCFTWTLTGWLTCTDVCWCDLVCRCTTPLLTSWRICSEHLILTADWTSSRRYGKVIDSFIY